MKRYYFDYAAGTPLDPRVKKAMEPYWSEKFGNPGALHWFGQEASAAVFNARDIIAKELGSSYKEIIFTGSATEANNLALRGAVKSFRQFSIGTAVLPKIIISSIEHDSVLETAKDLEKDGVEVVYLPVSKEGIVDLKRLEKELDERTILVSVMYVNNEVGAIQPIAKISEIIRNFREVKCQMPRPKSGSRLGSVSNVKCPAVYPLLHTDAVQAFNYLKCDVNELGVDLLTLSAQKIYGPKGVGVLYFRQVKSGMRHGEKNNLSHSTFPISPIITGGSQQEYGLRGGTENVSGIVGLGKAVELVSNSRELENKRLRQLQKYFFEKLKKFAPLAKLNGPAIGEKRIPNNINLYFPKKIYGFPESIDGSAQDLLIKLDLAGFAISSGAACTARVCQPSHVLKAMGFSDERAMGSLRFTFGRPTTKRDINKLLEILYFKVK